MASAVFEPSHPLDRYLAQTLDDAFRVNMPGASDDLTSHPSTTTTADAIASSMPEPEDPSTNVVEGIKTLDSGRWRPLAQSIVQMIATVAEYAAEGAHASAAAAFAERFKYVIISSNLLDTGLSPTGGRPTSPLPPSLPPPPPLPPISLNTPTSPQTQPQPESSESDESSSSFLRKFLSSSTTKRNARVVSIVVVLALNGYIFFALVALFFLTTTRTKEREAARAAKRASYASTLHALDALVAANDTWNGVVTEAVGTLEAEERRLFYGPTPVTSPSSSLRVALSSTLLSTQSQTDNVRQLFAPLTSSSQLAKLSEMYCPPAPPTPKPMISSTPTSTSRRPMSMMGSTGSGRSTWRGSVMYTPKGQSASKEDKRKTWAGMPVTSPLRRASSLEEGGSASSPTTGPKTPSFTSRRKKRLSTVMGGSEEEREEASGEGDNSVEFPSSAGPSNLQPPPSMVRTSSSTPPSPLRLSKEDPFTATPPMIRRRRRNSSLSSAGGAATPPRPILNLPLPSAPSSPQPQKMTHSRSHNSLSVSTSTTPAKHTPARLQTTRHPLSLASLRDQVNGAMASKRFTSSHLLALRFQEDGTTGESGAESDGLELLDGGDESYWEDVRSVMGLLTSALEDGAARLVGVLEESKEEKEKDSVPSPMASGFHSKRESLSPFTAALPIATGSPGLPSIPGTPAGSGFAPGPTHVARFAAHVNALVDAMEMAKEQLRACVAVLEPPPSASQPSPPIENALQSYDKVRKELSTALREFERGRGSLLDLIKHRGGPNDQGEDEGEGEDVPALEMNDQSSVEADSEDRHHHQSPTTSTSSSKIPAVHDAIYLEDNDHAPPPDVLVVSQSPEPPQGIEQVFAFDRSKEPPPASTFLRERSKLSREERIALKRRSLMQSPPPAIVTENWGKPGGDVVRELKDVIQKVEERRRVKRLSVIGDLVTATAGDGSRNSSPVSSKAMTSPQERIAEEEGLASVGMLMMSNDEEEGAAEQRSPPAEEFGFAL